MKDRITISLDPAILRELKKSAIDSDKGYSEYAEELLSSALTTEGRNPRVRVAAVGETPVEEARSAATA